MPVKTITIDTEAYELLVAERQANESLSEVIKRRLRPDPTAAALLDSLPGMTMSEDALDQTERLIRAREEPAVDSSVAELRD